MNDNEMAGLGASPARARGRPKQRPDSEERQRILAVACDLFLDVGYGGTTMDAVASGCGISKKTLYRLFPAKTDLLKAMVADHRRTMLALPRAEDGLATAEALAAIFRLDIDETENRERLAFIRLAMADADRYPEIGEAIALEGAQAALQLLATWLGEQQARGVLRPFPPEAAARMLIDMIFSVLVKRYPGDSLLTGEQRIGHARRCIEVFLDGMAERPAAA